MTAPEPTLRTGLASNIAGVTWTAAMVLLFTPLFIRRVGVEGYGLIGFSITLQALLQVLDLGFAPTINRWLSRYSAGAEEPRQARDFARTLELGSWAVALAAGALLMLLAGVIGELWLRETRIADSELRSSLRLMAWMSVAQLPATYYQSALLGLRRPVVMNVLRATAATAANGGAALLLIVYAPSVQTYFAVQAGVAVAHAIVLRGVFWRAMRGAGGERGRFRLEVLRTAWRFTAGMTAIAVCATFIVQADRLLVSRLVPLRDFGYYAIAWTLASGLAVVSLPALNTFFPRFSGLFAAGDAAGLRRAYHAAAQMLSMLLLPLASVIVAYAFPILAVWTGDVVVAEHAAAIAALLTAGMALNGLMVPAYALQIAAGATRLALALSVALIVTIVPLVTLLALRYGVAGAAFAWPAVSLVYLAAGSVATFRRLLPGAWRDWFLRDAGVPLAAAAASAAAARAWVPLPDSRIGTLAVIGVVLLGVFGVTVAASRAAAADL